MHLAAFGTALANLNAEFLMNENLKGKRIAILVAEGFEQVEMVEPRRAIEEAGGDTQLVSCCGEQVKAWNEDYFGDSFPVDLDVSQAKEENFDGLLIPGGVMSPDSLRTNSSAVDFVRRFFAAGKPVAAICHGPWMLVEADVVRDRSVTSYPSIKTDLKNAGAQWVDQEVVVDHGLVTSRKPDDIPAFNRKMVEEFAEGRHAKQRPLESGAVASRPAGE